MTSAPPDLTSPPGPELRAPALRRDAVVAVLGVAFLVAAIVVSASRARSEGDLDWSVYGIGIAATLVLLAFGLGARLVTPDLALRHAVAPWPLAFGAVGAGLMLGIGLDDGTSTSYLAGGLVLVVAAAGYAVAPSAPPVVAGIFGALVVYGQAFTDTADFELAEDNGFKTFAVAVLLFVAIVTAVGWALPPARTTVAVVAGFGAVLAYVGIMAAIAFTTLFLGFSSFDDPAQEPPSYDGDVYTVFAAAALLVAGWTVLGYLTDSPGFRAVVVAMVGTVYPTGAGLLAVEHPTAWSLAAAVVGGVALLVVGLRVLASRGAPTEAPVAEGEQHLPPN